MKDSLTKLEKISSVRTRLSHADNSHIKALGKMMHTNLFSLPSHLSAVSTPDDTLYPYLCCNPSADTPTKAHHANNLIRSLHPNKTGSSKDPPAVAASRLIPFLTNIKRVFTQPALRAVYDHCGLTSLQELLDNRLGCPL